MNPWQIESAMTVFDFVFFVNNLCDELIAENKEKEKSGNDRLTKMLRAMKNVLNGYDI